jgi:SEC-C motif
MLPNFESFLDATPEKGVIIVEYYWQPTPTSHPAPANRNREKVGVKTSMVFFKRILASDKCWCGSKRQFARCHRRADDWSYVTFDPGQQAYSPVVLLDQTFTQFDYNQVRAALDGTSDLLPIEQAAQRAVWGLALEPRVVNEIGTLILGTVELSPRELHLATNSEKRFEHLGTRVEQVLGRALGGGEIRRAEPQKAFPPPAARRKRKASTR